MVRTLRRSMILIFFAFVLFGLAWLFFAHMNDPLSQWEPIVRVHPEVDVTFRVIVNAGEIAFLMVVALGVPIILSAIKQAFIMKRKDVLVLFGIAAFASIVFVIATVLVIAGLWNGGTNGGLIAILLLLVLITVTTTLALGVTRSEPSARVLRFALVPATIVTMAMGVALVATVLEALFLSSASTQGFTSADIVNWVIADGMMVIATGCAAFALWRGLHGGPTLIS